MSDGPAFWVDANGHATTTSMAQLSPSRRLLERIRVARGFTAYQHFGAICNLPLAVNRHIRASAAVDSVTSGRERRRVRPDHDPERSPHTPALIVTPGLDALYRAGALHDEAERSAGNLEDPLPVGPGVPLINKVAAGYPTDFTDLDYPARVADEYVACPGIQDPEAFAARVVGESMQPRYEAGDILIFSPRRDPADGSDCFARLLPDHHTTFKRVFFDSDDRVRLQPLNPAFSPQVVPLDQVAGLYPAVFRMQAIGP
jgi:SOS-response transcriptional repressor LexA